MLACGRPEAPAPTYGISGTVSGAPTSGVTMSLSGPGLTTDETTTTDSSGNYSFTGLREGTYTVKPSLKAYLFRPASAPAVVTGANVPGLNFSGRPSLQVYGRDMGPYWQNVSILQGGVRVNDATVRVNGQLMTHPDGWYEDGYDRSRGHARYFYCYGYRHGSRAAIPDRALRRGDLLAKRRHHRDVDEFHAARPVLRQCSMVLWNQLRHGYALARSWLGSNVDNPRQFPAFWPEHHSFGLRIQ
jgi:hypothetical protein